MEILLYTGHEFEFSDQFKEEYAKRKDYKDAIEEGDTPLLRQNSTCIAIVKEMGSEWCSAASSNCSVRVETIPEVLLPYLSIYKGEVDMYNWEIIRGKNGEEQMYFFDLWPRITKTILWEMLGLHSETKPTAEDIDRVRAKFVAISSVIELEDFALPSHLLDLKEDSTTSSDVCINNT